MQGKTLFFICGSALHGQPDHHNLGEAEFVTGAKTQPSYRMHNGNEGRHPAIYTMNEQDEGTSILGEVYALTDTQLSELLASEPPDLVLSSVKLEGGEEVAAMLCPKETIDANHWPDISPYGGWAAFKAANTG